MVRLCLTDAQWAKMELHCLDKTTDPGRTGADGRLFWKRFCGLPARVALGEICLRFSANGTRCLNDTGTG